MSELGAILQKYNQELVKNIEQLKQRRKKLSNEIDQSVAAKQELVKQMDLLKKELEKVDENISKKSQQRIELDKTLNEADMGLKKIVESSEVILNAVKRESSNYCQINKLDDS